MENNRTNDTHEITLINKEKGTITGVNKVLSVKDDCIALETSMGELAISGKNFVISGYNDFEYVNSVCTNFDLDVNASTAITAIRAADNP